MIKVYCYSRCTTCRKALKWLDDNGVDYSVIDIRENHPKKLPEMSEDEQLALLATDGILVKRPLVVGDGFVLTGFKEAEWASRMKQSH